MVRSTPTRRQRHPLYFYYGISALQSEKAGVSIDWLSDESLNKEQRWEAFLNWATEMKKAGGENDKGFVTAIDNGAFEALYPSEPMTGSALAS